MSTLTFNGECWIRAASDGTGQPPRVEIRAYTGGVMRVPSFGSIVLAIDGMQLSRVSLLCDHENSLKAIAGTGLPEVRNGELFVVGTLAVGTAAAEQVLSLHRGGVKLQASIGCEPLSQKFVDGGHSIQTNGRTVTAPSGGMTFVAKSKLREVSFVAAGADADTSVSIAASRRGQSMGDASFLAFVSEMLPHTRLSDLTAKEAAVLHANYHGRSDPTDSDFAATARYLTASSDVVSAETWRLAQIDRLCAGNWTTQAEQVAELKASAIENKVSVDQLLEGMRAIRIQQMESSLPLAHTIYSSSHNDQQQQKIVEACFCLQGGLANIDAHYSEPILDAADRISSTVSLQQLVLAAAAENGYPLRPGEQVGQGNWRNIMRSAFQPAIRGSSASTQSLPSMLSNVANKFMREGFDSVDQTALRISAIRPVKDFKQTTTISLLGGMEFQQLAPGGKIEHGQVAEEVYHNKAATYAIMFGVDRESWINDDASVLSSVPRRIGRGGMLKLNKLVWTLYLDNASFFTTALGNLVEEGSDLSLTGLQLAEQAFLNQTDPDGNPLGIMPSILLVPPSLRSTALTLMNSQLVISSSSSSALPNANIWQGRFSVESSPYMEVAAYSGSSAAAWYLLASPSQMPVIEIAALNGQVAPVVETADPDFDQLGVQFRGYCDVGVALQEYRGGVKATGAAASP